MKRGAENGEVAAQIGEGVGGVASAKSAEKAVLAVQRPARTIEAGLREAQREDGVLGRETGDEIFGIARTAFIDILLGAGCQVSRQRDAVHQRFAVGMDAARHSQRS